MLDEVDGMVNRPKLRAEVDAALGLTDAAGAAGRPMTPEEWATSPEAKAANANAMAQMRRQR